jgi:phospholipase C
VRVPAVIVSPFVAPGSVLRPPPPGEPGCPFDHTSIIATVERLFGLAPPLTPRVAAAPDLLRALTLETPENDGPERIAAHPRRPTAAETRAHARRPHNRLQRNLKSVRAGIPGRAARVIAHGHRLHTRLGSKTDGH